MRRTFSIRAPRVSGARFFQENSMPSLGDLIISVVADIACFNSAMQDVSSTAVSTADKAQGAASKINQVFSAAFGAGITTLAIGAANKFESAFAQIQRSTGATE